MKTFDKEAERGAKLLDQFYPDWYQKIDLKILNLSDCCQCILGQWFGNYFGEQSKEFLTRAGIPGFRAAAYWGFSLSPADDREAHNWIALTHRWREEIQKRLDKDSLQEQPEEQPEEQPRRGTPFIFDPIQIVRPS